jgi:hypothetical protein
VTPADIEADRKDAPERIWLDWKEANDTYTAFAEPPENEFQDGQVEWVRGDIQAARIAALEARVRELEAGLRVREGWLPPLGHPCATQGCDRPSTVRFVRGGIGTDYCGECYLKVQSVIGEKP